MLNTSPRKRPLRRLIFPILLMIVIYVLLGNARSVAENPFFPGASISVNRIVPVLGGVLFGPWAGLAVGLLGTAFNAVSPGGGYFEWLSILPHALMGLAAGILARMTPTPLPMLAVYLGIALQAAAFWIAGETSWIELSRSNFIWRQLSDGLVTIMAALVVAALFRITAASVRD
ncbi:MAG: ECF transporter S component [Leptospirales bacterium]|nr:ECF transporter S component [Leptospirales bacterium]